MQSTYTMIGTVAGSPAAMDIRADGTLEGVLFNGTGIATAGTEMTIQLSWISTLTSANDSTSPIATAQASAQAANDRCEICVFVPCQIKVNAGERVYLHVSGAGGFIGNATLYINDQQARTTRTRR